MKHTYDRRTGVHRLWIDPEEIEATTESELVKASLLPSLEAPVVDIEAFIERHLGAQLDHYAPLPVNVLGQTDFRPGAGPRILINANLTGAAMDDDDSPLGLKGRWRATAAHEACHILFHRRLFNLNPDQGTLFAEADDSQNAPQRLQRCLKPDVLYTRGGADWREVQANMGMAALLMPRSLFVAACRQELSRRGIDQVVPETSVTSELARHLAELFQVSRQAATIRLMCLKLVGTEGQINLM